ARTVAGGPAQTHPLPVPALEPHREPPRPAAERLREADRPGPVRSHQLGLGAELAGCSKGSTGDLKGQARREAPQAFGVQAFETKKAPRSAANAAKAARASTAEADARIGRLGAEAQANPFGQPA